MQVLVGNPAVRLYERLGFVEFARSDAHIEMELPSLDKLHCRDRYDRLGI